MFYYLYHMYISIPIDKFIKDDLLNTVFNFIYKKFINIYIYIYIDIHNTIEYNNTEIDQTIFNFIKKFNKEQYIYIIDDKYK